MTNRSFEKVAIIIPVFNPPLHWGVSCFEHIVALQALYPKTKFVFVFVDDGSRKGVFRHIIKTLKNAKVSFNMYTHMKNFGKGRALRTGVEKVRDQVQYILCVDWDFPFGIFAIGSMLEKLRNGSDVVIADRGKEYLKKIPLFRSLLTRLWRVFVIQFLGLHVKDTQGGLKGFRTSTAELFLQTQTDSFLHDLEFILLCERNGKKVAITQVDLKGGVRLTGFSLATYLRELYMLFNILANHYFKKVQA